MPNHFERLSNAGFVKHPTDIVFHYLDEVNQMRLVAVLRKSHIEYCLMKYKRINRNNKRYFKTVEKALDWIEKNGGQDA